MSFDYGLIGSLGFPIVMCLLLYKDLRIVIKSNTDALIKINDTMKKCKK